MTSPMDRADPYKLRPYGSFGIGLGAASGRARRDPRITPGQSTGVIASLGQSLICNSCLDSPANVFQLDTTASPLVHNLNIIDGGVYRAKDALLGCHGTGRNVITKLGDLLIAAGKYQRVILAPIGFSASHSANWAAGGDLNHRIAVLIARLAAVNLPLSGVLWQQGSANAAAGTSQAATEADLQSVIATFRNLGITCPIFISKESWQSSALPSNAPTRAAQAAVVNPGLGIYAAGDSDTMTAGQRYDDLHLNYSGRDALAALHYAAMVPILP